MADDIKLKWGSTGFEKIAGELAQMEKQAGGAGKWFTPMQQNLQETEKAGTNMSSSLLSSLGSIMPVVGQVAIKIAEIGTAIMATAAVITGAGVAAFTMWSNSILKTTESFSMLEISMYGATKSWESVAKVSEFAKGYAAEYPAMYKDVMQAMQSFAYISSMRPMIERGDVKEMKEMMDVIQGLITMRPEQGVTGAMMALREALGGNWRSLQMRFDVPIKSIAASAGMTMEQMKASPEAGAKALKAFIDSFVGAETMAMMAKNLTIQIGNLKDKYEMWLDTLGKTGIYQKVVDYVIKLNDVMEQVSKSEQWQKFTVQLNAVLEGIAEGIAGIFTKGVGWDKVIDLTSLLGALDKVANNAMEAMSAAWDKLKEPLFAAMNLALLWAQQKLIVATREIFIPVGIGIGQAIIQGMKQFMEGAANETWLGKLAMKLYSFSPIGLATQTPLERAVPEFLRGQGGMVTSETDQTPLGKAGERFKNAINTLWDDMSKGLDNLVDKVKTGGKKAMSAFDDMAEKEKERLKKEQKMSDFMGKQKWSEFQSWSRMGMTLAQMPEGKPRGWWSTVAGQYATGKIDYATMLKQEPVEKFQKEQEKKLQEMITTEAGAEVPSFGLMRNAYEQLFNIAAKGGEGGKAKDYMNKALDAMQADMKQQTANQRKELKLLEGIEEHTAVIAGGYGKETPEGKKTTYVPTGPNVSDDIRLDVQNMGPWGTGF